MVLTMVKSLIVGIPFTGSGEVAVRGERRSRGESVRKSLGDSLIALSAFLRALIFSRICRHISSSDGNSELPEFQARVLHRPNCR